MKEITGNIWELAKRQVICITTNGIVNSSNEAIMGKGISKEAKYKFPGIEKQLGEDLITYGNHVHYQGVWTVLTTYYIVYSFPTKYHWRHPSSLNLIKQSAQELVKLEHELCFLPRPGCGNGGLNWKDVKPVLEGILDDNFIIVNRD